MFMLLVLIVQLSHYLTATEQHNAVEAIPLEILFKVPDLDKLTISPNGSQIAYLAPYNNSANIWVQNIDGSNKRCLTYEKHGLRKYFWGYDNQTIFYYQDYEGDENWNLYKVDLATGKTHNLTPYPNVQVRGICYSPKHSDLMLIGMNKEQGEIFDVYLLNTATGEIRMVDKNPGNIAGLDSEQAWYADSDLNVRIGYSFDEKGGTVLLYRDNKNAPWRPLLTWDVNASAASGFIGFSPNYNEIYLADASETDKAQLVIMNVVTGKKTLLAQDPDYDIIPTTWHALYQEHPSFLFNPITGSLAALFFERDVPHTIVFDEELKEDFMVIASYKLGHIKIRSTDNLFQRWIVVSIDPDRPVNYYMYDRTKKTLNFIGSGLSECQKYKMGKTEPIEFTARDGKTIHGYVTYPATTSSRTNLPLVVFVHGGPWIRDYWTFDPWLQFFATRGYLCLEVNFRGSSGYGTEFVKISNKEYAGTMQYDLIDGAQWLVDQGIADRHRMAIFGTSFGGYAALAAATFNPHFFRCSASLCARANMLYTPESVPPYWKPGLIVWNYRRGNPATDEDLLRAQSPIFHLSNICIPILLAHGAHDARIQQTESDRVADYLQKNGMECEYVLLSREGHRIINATSKIELFTALEHFLARHLLQKMK